MSSSMSHSWFWQQTNMMPSSFPKFVLVCTPLIEPCISMNILSVMMLLILAFSGVYGIDIAVNTIQANVTARQDVGSTMS